jgi:hypothetical protein
MRLNPFKIAPHHTPKEPERDPNQATKAAVNPKRKRDE